MTTAPTVVAPIEHVTMDEDAGKNLKVFLLVGQSNMDGVAFAYNSAKTDTRNVPSMEFLLSGTAAANTYLSNLQASGNFDFVSSLDASWLDPRDDVWGVYYSSDTGTLRDILPTNDPADRLTGIQPMQPGFGIRISDGSMFGSELSLGVRLGDAMESPIFLFKSSLGGTTLAEDWRPPDAVAARGGAVGVNYTNTMTQFISFLDDLDADLADDGILNAYNNATGYEVAGVYWLQGWNEQFNGGEPEYADNLVDLIHSIRAEDPRIPNDLGLIIGESADQNATLNAARQEATDRLNAQIPNSASFFHTDGMKNTDYGNNELGAPFSTSWGYHYHARAENFLEIGWKAADAALTTGMVGADAPDAIDLSAVFTDTDLPLTYHVTANTDTSLVGTTITGSELAIIPAPDANGTAQITVRATDSTGLWTEDTFTVTINPVNDMPGGTVVVKGSAKHGETLTADTSGISDIEGLGPFSYQWQRDSGGGFADISGAASDTYLLGAADIGATVRVVVSYTDGFGTAESVTSSPTAVITEAPPSITAGIITQWTFNEGSGTMAADTALEGVKADNGTLTGGAGWSADGIGGALDLSAGGYLAVSDSADVNISTMTQRTIALSFYADSTSGRQMVFEEGGITNGLTIYLDNGGLYVGGWGGRPAWQTYLSTSAVTAGRWHHVAVTLDSDGTVLPDALTGYLDGVAFGSGDGGPVPSHVGDVGVGQMRNDTRFHDGNVTGAGNQFLGLIDQVKIYNRPLDATEVAMLAAVDVNFPVTGSVVITGTPTQDQTLTADAGGLADPNGLGPFSYQWQRDPGGGFADIAGATASTYVLDDPDVGATVRVVVSFTDGSGTLESVTSAPTTAVVGINDTPTLATTISDMTVNEGASPTVIDLSGVFTDVQDGAITNLSVTANTNAALVGTSITGTDLTLSYTASTVGTADITVRGTDLGGLWVEDTFTVTVNQVSTIVAIGIDLSDGGNTAGSGIENNFNVLSANGGITAGNVIDINGSVVSGVSVTAAGISGEMGERTLGFGAAGVGDYTDTPFSDLSFNDGVYASGASGQIDITMSGLNDGLTYDVLAIVGGPTTQNRQVDVTINANTQSQTYNQFRSGDVLYPISFTGVSTDGGGSLVVTFDSSSFFGVSALYVVGTGSANSEPIGSVVITGTPTEDQLLTADTRSLADADGLGALSYQWQRDTGGGFADISGATASTYLLDDADVGAEVRVIVSFTDGGGALESVTSTPTAAVAASPKLASGVVTVDSGSWHTIQLGRSYTSMVVVATVVVPDSSRPPMVTRIDNASGSSFDLMLQRIDGQNAAVSGVQVQYMVIEEGVYTAAEHGMNAEAVKLTSTMTNYKNHWDNGQAAAYQNSYTAPVVVGQVMSYHDTDHSSFWARGSARTSPPDSANLYVGKHVGEDPDTTRADETLGYIVFESGTGTLGGVTLAAGVTGDTVRGVDNGATGVALSGLTNPASAVLSSAGMDGIDGGMAVLRGVTPVTAMQLMLNVDEDTLNDNERGHTTEQIAYVVFAV